MIASQNGLQDLKRHINNTFRKHTQVQTSHGFAKKQTKSLNTFLGFKKAKMHLLIIMVASQDGLQDLKRCINNVSRENIQVQTSHGFTKKQTKSLKTFLRFKKTKMHLLIIMCDPW
jgi:hypothetical protein